MLKKLFKDLDNWTQKTNKELIKETLPTIKPFYIKVLGQTALIESKIKLNLFSTMDMDMYSDCNYLVKKELERLLSKHKKFLDGFSNEIWMPKETEYELFYEGKVLKAYLAKAEYVLISKALKAPEKNKNIIQEYLSKQPSELFIKLAKKYKVDLKVFHNAK